MIYWLAVNGNQLYVNKIKEKQYFCLDCGMGYGIELQGHHVITNDPTNRKRELRFVIRSR